MSLKSVSLKKLRKIKHKWKVESWEEYDKRESELYRTLLQNREPTVLGQIKISAGKVKNFMLDIPRTTRPLTSRLKTTVFNILGPDISHRSVLDLFAGTGSFGFEALSRGAKSCTFVDVAKEAERILIQNSKRTGFLTETNVVRQKADEYLVQAAEAGEVFDIIFVDPPYKLYNTRDMSRMNTLFENVKKLMPGIKSPKSKKFKGALLIKHPRKYDPNKFNLEGVVNIGTYEFGLNSVTFFIVA